MRATLLLTLLLFIMIPLFAQKQNFDVVSYTTPKGWRQAQNDGGLQLSTTDKKTGGYIIAIITKATASAASANDNFTSDWDKLVKASVQVSGDILMSQPTQENGWEIISGGANYIDGNDSGMATLLTATGGGQMVSVLLMTNAKQYQEELLSFLNSLELSKASSKPPTQNKPTATNKTANTSLVGMWIFYNTESSGMYNGFPQLTGGYMRREYIFYGDGTYLFRAKDWMVYVKDILYVYETGTYTVSGNQITITPKKGKGEWWSKVQNNTSAWGKLVRASTDYKLEKTTYAFDLSKFAGNQASILILKTNSPTVREGSDGDKTTNHEFRYESRDSNKSLIDNPPGFKTGFENKSLTPSATIQTNAILPIANSSSPLAGKI